MLEVIKEEGLILTKLTIAVKCWEEASEPDLLVGSGIGSSNLFSGCNFSRVIHLCYAYKLSH